MAINQSHRYPYWTWFGDFLREELRPYPGRWEIAARMILASTAVAVISMVFRIPRAYQGAAYTFLVSREVLENNWRSAFRLASGTIVTTAYVLVSVCLFIGSPPLHFLWIVASFFLAFYLVSAAREYASAVPVAVVIGTGVTYWDRPLRSGENLSDTLWFCLACVLGVILTAAVSSLFGAFRHRDALIKPLSDRLRLVEEVLRSCADGKPVIPEVARQLNDAVMAGTSAWRLTLHRSGSSRLDRDRLSAIGSLVGRLVDIAANLPPHTAINVSRAQAVHLADGLAEFRAALLGTGALKAADFEAPEGGPIPFRQIARTLQLMTDSWTKSSK